MMLRKLNNTKLLTDILISAMVLLVICVVSFKTCSLDTMLNNYDKFSSTLIGILATILGFLITADSILLTVKETKYIKALIDSGKYAELLKSFINTCYIITINLILISLLSITNNESRLLWYTNMFLTVLSFTRLFTCIRVLKKVISLALDK